MATILKANRRKFEDEPDKIAGFRLLTDVSRSKKGVDQQYLNFDLRQLPPGQSSAPYHFHRYADELFMIISGSATIRTPDGAEIVESGDLLFFETGETGAHQLYNHTDEPCVYLDARTYVGYDVCEYPDSNKILIAPSLDVFDKNSKIPYFTGEENIKEKWEK